MALPKTWKKYGEVYCADDHNKCIFVCSVCLESVEHIYFAFSTSDASDFWTHIQQHITADCEILKETAANKSPTETQPHECDNRKSLETDCNIYNIEDSTDSPTVDQFQDKIEMLDKFHESLVGNFGKTDQINKNTEAKDPQQLDVKMEPEMDLNEFRMETQIPIKNESVVENNSILNGDNVAENTRNVSFDSNNEIYTISDDEDNNDNEKNENHLLDVVKERSARDYLAHNDMIELSDDDDLDEVDTRPNSPQTTITAEEDDNVETQTEEVTNNFANCGYSYNCSSCHITFSNRKDLVDHLSTHEIEVNAQQNEAATTYPTDSVNCIPTPAASPNDVVYNQNVATNLQPYQCSYCPQRFCEAWQLERHQRLHLPNSDAKRKFKSRPFQCNSCGKRTSTEKNMIIHQRRFHSPESDCETTLCKICQKRVLSKNFEHHMLTHSINSRAFQCKDCGKRTSSKRALKTHKNRFHNPESGNLETTLCEICQKRILAKNIQQHLWTHTQNRYKCDHCSRTYKQKLTLRKHISKAHPNVTTNFSPSICTLPAQQTAQTSAATTTQTNDNPEISPQPILGSSLITPHIGNFPEVAQPQLTPEEQQLMYSVFLRLQSQITQNQEQSST